MQLYPKARKTESRNAYGMLVITHHKRTKLDKFYFKYVFFPIISPVLGYFAAKRNVANYLNDIIDIEIDGIDRADHPDYVDAFITKATWRSSLTDLTEAQLDQLNDRHSDFVYEAVQDYLF